MVSKGPERPEEGNAEKQRRISGKREDVLNIPLLL